MIRVLARPDWGHTSNLVCLVFAIVYAFLLFFGLILPRRQFRRSIADLAPESVFEMWVDDDGILSRIPGRIEQRISWAALYDVAKSSDVTNIYFTRDSFLFFPNSALDEDQRAELTDLIARHLPKRKS